MELVACPIPYGTTLLVDAGCIHGDSTLTGTYSMAMTANHEAMATADTVYLKNRSTRLNAKVMTSPVVPPPRSPPVRGSNFLMTSDEKPLSELIKNDVALKAQITASLGRFEALWWKPVVSSLSYKFGWNKSLGTELPVV